MFEVTPMFWQNGSYTLRRREEEGSKGRLYMQAHALIHKFCFIPCSVSFLLFVCYCVFFNLVAKQTADNNDPHQPMTQVHRSNTKFV